MKYGVARLVISILFIVFLVGPAAVSGSTIPDVSEYEVAYPPEIQPFDTAATTSPPVIVSDASIRSTSAVYIDEQNPSAKHNALPFSAHG
jgi:hypothetical protein